MIRLWLRWVAVVSGGELAGFAVPASAATVVTALAAGWQWRALVAAGAAEGMLLGVAQASVLAHALPGFDRMRWVTSTSGAAALAWAMAMPVAVLLSIGVAQWLVLRRYVTRCAFWIGVTAAAWIAGLLALTGAPPRCGIPVSRRPRYWRSDSWEDWRWRWRWPV